MDTTGKFSAIFFSKGHQPLFDLSNTLKGKNETNYFLKEQTSQSAKICLMVTFPTPVSIPLNDSAGASKTKIFRSTVFPNSMENALFRRCTNLKRNQGFAIETTKLTR